MPLVDGTALKRKIVGLVTVMVVLIFLVGFIYGILDSDFLPGTEIFALFVLALSAYIGSLIINIVRLPPLLGMLLMGMLFRNWSYIPFYNDISAKWSSILRDCALTVILLKAGMGLDPGKLMKLKFAVFKLSLIPCLCEAVSSAIFSHYLLDLPWLWSLMLGFIISAVSAAVLVPGMLHLDAKQIGSQKGISTLIMASVSIDNIAALTGFFVTISFINSGEVFIGTIIKRPLEPFLGLLIGGILGILLWCIPSKTSSSLSVTCNRVLLLCFGGFSLTFLSKKIGFAGAGALGCVSFAFVSSLDWRKDVNQFKTINWITGLLWAVLEIFLFSLIGAQVTIESLQTNIGNGLLVLFLGIAVRFIITTISLWHSKLNFKEKMFISASWISKATVQAAVGSQALEYMKPQNKMQEIQYAEQVLSLSVLSIILTAPLGAMVIDCLGRYLLADDRSQEEVGEKQSLIRVVVTDYSTEISHQTEEELEGEESKSHLEKDEEIDIANSQTPFLKNLPYMT